MTSLLDHSQVSFDAQTQAVIVGAGACGLVAALVLAKADIDVLVIERDANPSGSTSLSSGFIPAASSRVQRCLNIDDSAELFASDIQRKAGNEADRAIVKVLTEQSGPVLDWLEEHFGFTWIVLDNFLYPGHSAYRMHALVEKTGLALHSQLLTAAQDLGVSIVTDARVDVLVTRQGKQHSESIGSPEVCGIGIVRRDGATEYIGASHVILACNGYGGNAELVQRFIPVMAKASYFGHAGNTGDAVLWGEALGAPLQHMSAYQGHGSVATGHNILITWALMMEGGIQINREGMRFSNEHGGYSEQAEHVIAQAGEYVWNIYDQRVHEQGLSFPDYQSACDAGAVLFARTREELAELTGVPVTSLEQTLDEIEHYALEGTSDPFGRAFAMHKRLKAPYCAIKVNAALFHTQGGLVVDDKARVLGADGRPIGGLLAAGGAACGVSGSRVEGYLSGNGLLSAVVLGFVAGKTVTVH